MGVHVHGFERSARRKEAIRQRRAYNLTLNAGDLYVFNSNRLHAVPAVMGPRDRVALGSFIGCAWLRAKSQTVKLSRRCAEPDDIVASDRFSLQMRFRLNADSASEILVWG